MASFSSTYPAQRPIFSLDAANAGRLDPRCSFTRASTANVWDGSKHLSSENLVLQSQSYDTTWTTYQLASSGALTGSQSAPDGTTTAWLVTAGNQTSGSPFLRQALSGISSSTEYTVSAYIKAGTASHGFISLRGNSGHVAWAEIDFTSPLSPTSGGANFSSISATSTAVGATGWYRLTLTCTTSTVVAAQTYVGMSDGTNPNNNGYPVWNCSGETIYVWGHQIEQRGSATVYNATTTQIHRAYAPSLVSKSNNIGRFDHTTDGQSMGILIEGQSTNLIERSHEVDNSYWNNANGLNVTVDANVAISPTGDLTADMLRPTTDATAHYLQKTVMATVASTTYTMSAYVKSIGGLTFRMYFVQSASPYTTIASGVFTLSGDGSVASVAGSASIEKVNDDGWYRISVTGAALTTTSTLILQPHDSGGNLSFAGDGYSGILCTGLQFEANSFPSSLISTSGSAVTRAAESLSVPTADIGYTGGPVSVVGEASGVNGTVVTLSDNTDNNRVFLDRPSGNWRMFSQFQGSSNIQTNVTQSGSSSYGKFAARFDTNNAALSAGGVTPSTDTGFDVPVMDKLNIGSLHNNITQLNGTIKRIALYNEALSDTNLQALTS
jgi:hypothetical protein